MIIANSNSDNISSTDRTQAGPPADGSSSPPPVTHLPWSAITDRPPILLELAGLADAPGVLRNDGAGVLSWDASAGSVAWADITGTPTDLAGYGITDAVDTSTFSGFVASLAAIAFSGAWSDLSGTPTDLAGYGITDAVDSSSFTGFVSTLSPVAFSGSIADLIDFPTLAAVATSGQAFDVAFSSSTGLTSTDVSSALDELFTLIGSGGGAVADGDYGDITVSSSGTVWTIDAATITPAKITNRTALSVFGRSANSSGVGADIAAGTDAFVLRRSGTTLGFGTIGDASISALAFSKLTSLPTTLAGHGITDAITAAAAAATYQPLDGDLTAVAALTTTGYAKRTATNTWSTVSTVPWSDVSSTPTTRAGYGITDAQPLDAELTALASLVSAVDQLPYFTGSGSASLTTMTPAARSVLDDTTVSAMLTTLGAAPAFTVGSSLSYASNVINAIQDIRTTATPSFAELTITRTSGQPKVTIAASAGGVFPGIGLFNSANSGGHDYTFNAGGASPGTFGINDVTLGVDRLLINSAGAIRLPAYGAGALTTDASGNVTATSDERLKTDIAPFSRGLAELLEVKPISFLWSKASGLDMGQRYSGFSAQNLQSCIPEAVGKMNGAGTQYLTLQERPILAAIVNALAEIDSRLVALEPKKPKK